MKNQSLHNCAQEIRSILKDLLPEDYLSVRLELDSIIERAAAGEDVEDDLLRCLSQHERTRAWMARCQEQPPIVDRIRELRGGSYPQTPLEPHPVKTDLFRCPVCEHRWARINVGEPVPRCPKHKLKLVRCE